MEYQIFFIFLILISLTNAVNPKLDLVTSIPGLNSTLPFKIWSGYLKASNTKNIHYVFTESSSGNSKNDPFVVWLNGGPGCSSMEGFINELGGIHVSDDLIVYINNNAWNQVANFLFLEAPVGVGFSYSSLPKSNQSDYSNDDCQQAEDNYNALKDFFNSFNYANNDVYISGESYGGIYVPTLVDRILKGNEEKEYSINIKGFSIGNPLIDYNYNTNSLIFFSRYHGLVGSTEWSELVRDCCVGGKENPNSCAFSSPSSSKCGKKVANVLNIVYNSGLNEYDLDQDCYYPNSQGKRLFERRYNFKPISDINAIPPCSDVTAMTKFFNNKKVQDAFHVNLPQTTNAWTICSDILQYKSNIQSTAPILLRILKKVRGMIYNGDTDMACNFLGDEWAVESLKLGVVSQRRMWKVNRQIAGFVKSFKNLDLVTIRGTGHMVPQWKPHESFVMFKSFINNKPLPS